METNRWGNTSGLGILFSIIFLLAAAAAAQSPPDDRLRIGIYNNPPKLFINKQNKPEGIFPGIIQEIAKTEGWEIEFIPLSFKEGLKGLESGTIDIMQDVAWSETRSKKYGFTEETVMVSWGRVYQKKGLNIATLIDLKGKRIAFMDGGIYSEGPDGLKALMGKFELEADFIPVNDYQQVFEYIHQGKADAGVVNRLFGKTNKHAYDIENTPILISPISIRFAFDKSNPASGQLIHTIDRHLSKLKADENSLYYQLIDQYLREPRTKIPAFLKKVLIFLVCLLAVFTVITILSSWQSRKKTRQIQERDQALRKSEKKFRTIFESFQDIYFDTDINGIIRIISPSSEKVIGIAPDKLMQTSLDDLFCLNPDQTPLTELLGTQDAVSDFQVSKKTPAGADQWLSITADKYSGENPQENGFRGIIRDITRQKHTEKQIIKREERFREMARLLPCGIIETDKDHNITYANQTCLDLFKHSRSDLERGISLIEQIHPDDVRLFEENMSKVHNRIPLSPVEFRLAPKGGKTTPVLWNCMPILQDGHFCGVRGSMVDLTEQKRSQKQMIRSQKLESTGILAGGIAHDFNNILLGIFGNMTLAKYEISPQSNAYELIEAAEKSMSRAKDLTNQLLTFAQGGDPIKQAITIDQVIRETAGFTLSGSNISVVIDKPEDLWQVNADKGQISQVIANLAINARQAMPDGGTLNIRLENAALSEQEFSSLKLDQYVKISMIDEGTGISEAHLEKIFDPYFTTKQDGSGLGLAIVHSIVLKHNGYIYVYSTPGKGTTFVLYLPTAGPETALPRPRTEVKRKMTTPGTLNILLMDDDPLVLDVSERILIKLGHNVSLSTDGESVIEMYRSALNTDQPFDLVIMDLTIPGGMGGKAAVEKLLEIDPDVVAVVASGYSTDPVMANFSDYGFKGMITKPYTIDKMQQVIQTAS